ADDDRGGRGDETVAVESQDHARGAAAVVFGVDVHGGERGREEGAVVGVVKADDGQVARDAQAEVAQASQDAQRDVVVDGGDGRHPCVHVGMVFRVLVG